MSNQYKTIRVAYCLFPLFFYSIKNGQKRTFLFENIKKVWAYTVINLKFLMFLPI